jgi:unsaturated chondroitin disaccharide hydrolase
MCNQPITDRLYRCRRSMLAIILLLALALPTSPARRAAAEDPLEPAIRHAWDFAAQQLDRAVKSIPTDRYPRMTTSTGNWETTGPSAWTSGFFPGALWLMFERTGNPLWRTRAETWTSRIGSQRTRTDTHDLGFMFMTSYGRGYRVSLNESYRQTLVEAAGSLAKRYDPDVRCVRSWGSIKDTTEFEVIVDNLMNLELLLWGARNGGNAEWRTMAINHGLRCGIQDLVRADGSTFHRAIYDPVTGDMKSRGTVQGACDACTWSRGEAWAVYGFTMLYGETGDTRFLEAARKTADYFIGHLPLDKVPYWDFLKSGSEPRDSSAASIAASGLLELSRHETDATRKQTYLSAARDILTSLSSPAYLAEGTKYWSILMHGTRNKPAGSYDTGLIFADYYMLEAMLRYSSAPAASTPTPTTPAILTATPAWPTATPGSPTATPQPSSTYIFAPVADTYVSQASPTSSYATSSQLQAVGDSSNAKQAFLRFNVIGLPNGASIASAKLRLVVANASTSGGVFSPVTDTSWPETITWNTRPAIGGPALATLDAVALSQVVELDVTGTIGGSGAFSFVISMSSTNTNTVGYASRESSTAANRPQLVITTR